MKKMLRRGWPLIALGMCLEPLMVRQANAQTTYTFNNLSSTWGSTGSNNWSTGNFFYPGLSSRGNSTGLATDIAQISLTGNVNLNVNFGSTGNGVGSTLTLGAIVYNTATGATNTWTFGSNAGTAGNFNLTGVTLAGTPNVILSNTAAGAATGSGVFTLAPTNGNTGVLTLGIDTGENNIVVGTGSGNVFGNTTFISATIAAGAGSIRVLGGGDATNRGGSVVLSGTSNAFTGGISVGNDDGTQAGRLRISTNASALPTSGNLRVNQYSQLRLDIASGGITNYGNAAQILTLGSMGAASGANINTGGLRFETGAGTARFNPAISLSADSGLHVETAGRIGQIAGIISGTGFGITKSGAGTLQFMSANTYSGTTWINNGILLVDAIASLAGGTANLKIGDDTVANNVTLTLNNPFQDIGTLSQGSAGGTKTIELNGSTELRITQIVAGTFDGAITGTNGVLNLAAASTAPLTLSGANTYTGQTFVNGGTLLVTGSLSAGGGTVTVASSATLGGTGPINRTVTSSGTIAPGTSIGTLNVAGATTINNVLEIEATATPTSDVLQVTGAGNGLSFPMGSTIRVIGSLNGTSTYTIATFPIGTFPVGGLSSFATLTGTATNIGLYSLDYSTPGQINLVPVPEPTTLLGLAAFGLVGVRLRRRSV